MKLLLFILAIKKITLLNIKQYLERKGWQVFFTNTSAAKKLVDSLGLNDILNSTDGLVYKKAQYKFVFINGYLSETDRLLILLHESAHIYLQHDLSNISKADEAQAWEFTYRIYRFKTILARKILTFAVLLTLFFAAEFMTQGINPANSPIASAHAVYVTHGGTHYHRANCRYVQDKDNCFIISDSTARKNYAPCSYCNP